MLNILILALMGWLVVISMVAKTSPAKKGKRKAANKAVRATKPSVVKPPKATKAAVVKEEREDSQPSEPEEIDLMDLDLYGATIVVPVRGGNAQPRAPNPRDILKEAYELMEANLDIGLFTTHELRGIAEGCRLIYVNGEIDAWKKKLELLQSGALGAQRLDNWWKKAGNCYLLGGGSRFGGHNNDKGSPMGFLKLGVNTHLFSAEDTADIMKYIRVFAKRPAVAKLPIVWCHSKCCPEPQHAKLIPMFYPSVAIFWNIMAGRTDLVKPVTLVRDKTKRIAIAKKLNL